MTRRTSLGGSAPHSSAGARFAPLGDKVVEKRPIITRHGGGGGIIVVEARKWVIMTRVMCHTKAAAAPSIANFLCRNSWPTYQDLFNTPDDDDMNPSSAAKGAISSAITCLFHPHDESG